MYPRYKLIRIFRQDQGGEFSTDRSVLKYVRVVENSSTPRL